MGWGVGGPRATTIITTTDHTDNNESLNDNEETNDINGPLPGIITVIKTVTNDNNDKHDNNNSTKKKGNNKNNHHDHRPAASPSLITTHRPQAPGQPDGQTNIQTS